MNLIRNFLFTLVSSLLLASCATSSIDRLSAQENQLKSMGGYNAFLALEYLSFARSLLVVKDNSKARHFAKKGLAVAAGEDVVPENPLTWDADPGQVEEMILMQKRLESTLMTPHLKFQLPIQTAHLTYLYDCWISRESKAIFRADELAPCRLRFYKLLGEIENYIDDLQKDKTAKVEIIEPKFERYEIMFDLDNDKFNDRANKDLLQILKYLASLNGDYHILLVGNADRMGVNLYNQSLALDRSEVVKNYLIKNGVHKDQIEMRSFGEDFPDIITKNGTQQIYNRSVGIYVLRGYPNFQKFPLPLIENFVYREEIKRARAERGLKD